MVSRDSSGKRGKAVKTAIKNPVFLNEDFYSFMEGVLSEISPQRGKIIKNNDPASEQDKKSFRDYARISIIHSSYRAAKAVFARKWEVENTLRVHGKGKEEIEKTAEKLGVKPPTVYWYRRAGKTIFVLFRAKMKFKDIPKSVDVLAEFGRLDDEHIVECYQSCMKEYARVTFEEAKESVASMMEQYPDQYSQKKDSEKKGESDERTEGESEDTPRVTHKTITAKIAKMKIDAEAFIAKRVTGQDRSRRENMKEHVKQLKEIVNLYEKALSRKT